MKFLKRFMAWAMIAAVLGQPGFGAAIAKTDVQTRAAASAPLHLRGSQPQPFVQLASANVNPVSQQPTKKPHHPVHRRVTHATTPVAVSAPVIIQTTASVVSGITFDPVTDGTIAITTDTTSSNVVVSPATITLASVSTDVSDTAATITVEQPTAVTPTVAVSAESSAVVASAKVEVAPLARPVAHRAPPAAEEKATVLEHLPVVAVAAPAAAPATPAVGVRPPLRPLVEYGEIAPPATNDALTLKAPVLTLRMPYQDALRCVASKLTDDERREAFTAGLFTDDSGHLAIAGADAAGSIGTINSAPTMRMALFQGGVTTTRTDREFRDVYGFQRDEGLRRELGDGMVRVYTPVGGTPEKTLVIPHYDGRMSPAEFLVEGNIVSIDNGGGKVFEFGVDGVSLGKREVKLNILMIITVSSLPLGPEQGGEVVDTFPVMVQVQGKEVRAGVFEFLGATPFAVSLDYKNNKRDALQYIEQVAVQGAGYQVLVRHFGHGDPASPLRECERYLPFATTLAH